MGKLKNQPQKNLKADKRFLTFGFCISLVLFLATETTLIKLAVWQHSRMHQRLDEQTAFKAAPKVKISGQFVQDTQVILLEHQRHKMGAGDVSGWRVFSEFDTEDGKRVWLDRGWTPYQRGAHRLTPDFTPYTTPQGTFELEGRYERFPERKEGGFGGATTTTHPQVLAFLSQNYLKSPSDHYFQTLTDTNKSAKKVIQPAFTPLASPAKHQEYMLTWLSLAVILPLLYMGLLFQRFKTFRKQ